MPCKKCDASNEDEDAQSSNNETMTTPYDAAQEDSTEKQNLNVTNINAGKVGKGAEAIEVSVVAPLGSDLVQEVSPLPRDSNHLHEGI